MNEKDKKLLPAVRAGENKHTQQRLVRHFPEEKVSCPFPQRFKLHHRDMSRTRSSPLLFTPSASH